MHADSRPTSKTTGDQSKRLFPEEAYLCHHSRAVRATVLEPGCPGTSPSSSRCPYTQHLPYRRLFPCVRKKEHRETAPWGGCEGWMRLCATGLWAELERGSLNTMYCAVGPYHDAAHHQCRHKPNREDEERKARCGRNQNCKRARWGPASCVLMVALCPPPPRLPSTRASPVVAPFFVIWVEYAHGSGGVGSRVKQ